MMVFSCRGDTLRAILCISDYINSTEHNGAVSPSLFHFVRVLQGSWPKTLSGSQSPGVIRASCPSGDTLAEVGARRGRDFRKAPGTFSKLTLEAFQLQVPDRRCSRTTPGG